MDRITIFHVDDETEFMEWVADSIYNYIDFYYRPSIVDPFQEIESRPDGITARFVVRGVDDSVVEIFYKSYEFQTWSSVSESVAAQDVLIFDAMQETDKGLQPTGVEFALRAARAHDTRRLFLLTAFPNQIPKAISQGIRSDRIYFKSNDPSVFVEDLIVTLNIRLRRAHESGFGDDGPHRN